MNEGQQELEFVPNEGESEEEVSNGLNRSVSSAVLWSTDWTAETILSQLIRGNIELNPSFQRREAWDDRKKSRFIESLILGFPVPQIVLAERKDKRGSYIVIDGKQRLLTIRRFCSPPGGEYEPFKLRGLSIRDDLNGSSYQDFQDNNALAGDLDAFQNQSIRTTVIRNWPDEKFLFAVFHRLNTGSVPLSPQELRQALHPGPFLGFVDDFASKCKTLQAVLRKDGPDFRMRDVELMIRFFAYQDYLEKYSGNLKEFLDYVCADLNQRWEHEENSIRAKANAFERALKITLDIFGASDAFRKWSGGSYERRFNRAVFDVMVYYFARLDEGMLESHAREVKGAFENLCKTEPRFIKAVESTTKSVLETANRLQIWGETLQELLGEELRVPHESNGAISFQ